jgi:hypothetical protein
MTGKLDTRMRGLAQRLVDIYGKAITLREFTGNTYDPSTGTNTPSYTDHAATGVITSFAERLIDGSSIKAGDLSVTVPAKDLTFDPSTEDKVRVNGQDWSIVNPSRTYSGEQVATYQLQIRR